MPSRRTVLIAAAGLASAVAGCGETPAGSSGTDRERAGTGDTAGTSTGDPTAGPTTSGAGTPTLDLREANVTAVELADEGGGEYRFDVTLYHNDDGEDGYANWWQVETLDGTRLGRRELLHAHSTAPFTRSETIAVPESVSCVVVRGHDQTHGYGGQAMVVSVPGGATRPVSQGRERRHVDAGSCP